MLSSRGLYARLMYPYCILVTDLISLYSPVIGVMIEFYEIKLFTPIRFLIGSSVICVRSS